MVLLSALLTLAGSIAQLSSTAPDPLGIQAPALALPPASWQSGVFSPDEQVLCLGSRTGLVVRIDLSANRYQVLRPADERKVSSLVWEQSPESLRIQLSRHQYEWRSPEDGALLKSLDLRECLPSPGSKALTFQASDLRVVHLGPEGKLPATLWSFPDGHPRGFSEGLIGAWDGSVAKHWGVSDELQRFAFVDQDKRISVWDLEGVQQLSPCLRLQTNPNKLSFGPMGRRLAISGPGVELRVWDYGDSQSVQTYVHGGLDLFGNQKIGHMSFSPDGRQLLTISYSFWEVCLWDLEAEKQVWMHSYNGGNPGCFSGRFSADGKQVLLAKHGLVLKATNGQLAHKLLPKQYPMASCNHPRLTWIQSAGQLHVFDWNSAELMFTCASVLPARK